MGEYKSRKHVDAEFTFDKEWWGRNVFEKYCGFERIFVLPSSYDGGEHAREACKLTLVQEYREYLEGSPEQYSCTWRVTAPEWRIWSLMERLDARGVPYETDFGLIVE